MQPQLQDNLWTQDIYHKMASLGKNKGPYELDYKQVKHKHATVTTIVNTPYFDNFILNMDQPQDYEVGYIPQG